MKSSGQPRNRLRLALALALIIGLGLASRKFSFLFPAMLGKYPGDALWALMVFAGLALIAPRSSTIELAIQAFGLSCAVEFFQLYQTPWLDAIRATTIGHLVLGSVFSWFDILAYAVGIFFGTIVDTGFRLANANAIHRQR